MFDQYDFGYSWIWTYGHLIPCFIFGLLALAAWRLEWAKWKLYGSFAGAIWSLAGLSVILFVIGIDTPMTLPDIDFLASGHGKVLDLGAGSGRTTLMVLEARPEAEVTALDLFSECCGIVGNTPDRLMQNARIAGVADRVTPLPGDMREIPAPDEEFDAVVTAYAIDHLGREGVDASLAEIHRVLKPGGELLLEVLNRDNWIRLAYPIFPHGYYGRSTPAEVWGGAIERAGFEIVRVGTQPGTLYIWARKQAQ